MDLTPVSCSVHTHTALCDGRDTPAAMAAAAFAAGVKHFGFSCHSHVPVPADEPYTLPVDMSAYRAEVLRLREVYAGRMEILLGIEWERIADADRRGFDYWIGSAHYLPCPGGAYCAVDSDLEQVTACWETVFHRDGLAMAEAYFTGAAKVAALRPTILGHIDLVTKFNTGNRFFDEEAPRYRAAALEALHAADPRETLLEINTGAVARGYRQTPYGAPFLLREWRAMGGRIILTADAHSADTVTFGYEEAAALAKAAGFERAVLLTMGGPVECAL